MADIDWLTCEWSGLYEEEDLPIAVCGEWGCPGDCFVCGVAEQAINGIFLPIYGPVTEKGEPLGYLLVFL